MIHASSDLDYNGLSRLRSSDGVWITHNTDLSDLILVNYYRFLDVLWILLDFDTSWTRHFRAFTQYRKRAIPSVFVMNAGFEHEY